MKHKTYLTKQEAENFIANIIINDLSRHEFGYNEDDESILEVDVTITGCDNSIIGVDICLQPCHKHNISYDSTFYANCPLCDKKEPCQEGY